MTVTIISGAQLSIRRHGWTWRAASAAVLWAAACAAHLACGSGAAAPNSDVGTLGSDAATDGARPADALPQSPDEGLQPTGEETAAFQAFLGDVNNELMAGHTPGASVAVVLHGKLLFAAGVGKKRKDAADPVTTETLFRVGSLSKMVVAAAAMVLVDEGKLDLKAPITKYVPWFTLAAPFDANTVTLEHLLTHSSGFPCDTLLFCGTTTSGEREPWFASHPQPLWAPPGAVHDYSNMGYTLASLVVTGAAGVADSQFETLVHDKVFVRAGMKTATYDAVAAEAADHATGYRLDAKNAVVATYEPTTLDCPLLHPPGGILATASDYGHFIEAMLAKDGRLLTVGSIAAMEAPHISMHTFDSQSYGYGLEVQDYPYRGHSLVWHGGVVSGFLATVFVVPDYSFGVVALVNAIGNRAMASNIAAAALDRFMSAAQQWPSVTTPSSTWSAYAGTYDDVYGYLGKGITVSVVEQSGKTQVLVSAPNAKPNAISGQMQQAAGDEWTMPDGTAATFFPDANGTPAAYFVTRNGIGVRQ